MRLSIQSLIATNKSYLILSSNKLYAKRSNRGGMQTITLFGHLPHFKILWEFEIFVNTGPCMGLEILKRYSSYNFHLISAKLYDDTGYHGGIQANVTFLGNQPSFYIFAAL